MYRLFFMCEWYQTYNFFIPMIIHYLIDEYFPMNIHKYRINIIHDGKTNKTSDGIGLKNYLYVMKMK